MPSTKEKNLVRSTVSELSGAGETRSWRVAARSGPPARRFVVIALLSRDRGDASETVLRWGSVTRLRRASRGFRNDLKQQ